MKKGLKKGLLISLVILLVGAMATYFVACSGSKPKPPAGLDGMGTTLPVPTDGSTPNDYSANENFYIAGTQTYLAEFETTSEGESTTKLATQKIESRRIVTKDEIFKQSVSYSAFKGTATRYYINGDNYILQGASKVSGLNNVKWKTTASKLTEEDYFNRNGYLPNGITGYVLTDETILSSELVSVENGNYTFRYNLDPDTATGKMRYEMRTQAGTKNYPTFSRAALIVTMDSNWRVLSTTTDCVYEVELLGGVTCNESVTETYHYKSNITIPEAEFFRGFIDAEVGGEPEPDEVEPLDYIMDGMADYLSGASPLKVNLSATSTDDLALNADAQAEIKIDINDLNNISARIKLNELALGGLKFNDLFIAYENSNLYVKAGAFRIRTTVDELMAKADELLPLFGIDLGEVLGSFGEIDPAQLLAGATLTQANGIATVTLPLTLGDLSANVVLYFDEGDTVTFTHAAASVAGVNVGIETNAAANVPAVGTGYYGIAPLLDLVDERGDVKLNLSIADINALVNVHLADMTADVALGDLVAKYKDGLVYASYKGLNVKLAVADIPAMMDKLAPIVGDTLALPDMSALGGSVDVMAVLGELPALAEEFDLAAVLDIVNGNYVLSTLSADAFGMEIVLAPSTQTVQAISNDSLGNFYNVTTLLNILDESNEINLNAEIAGFNVDLNVNLTTMTVLAKTELYGKTLHAKIENNKIYVSYMGLNVFVGMADINTILEKIKPFLGDSLDTGAFENVSLDIAEILNNITVVDGETLNLVANLFGMNATVALSKVEGNLALESVDVAMDGMSAFVTPANKAVYAMSTAPYYNAVTLLDLLDESNEINLNAEIAGFNVDLNVNLTTMTVLAKTELYGKTLHAKIENNKIYVSYMGLNVFVGMADINTILEKIKPFLGDSLDTGAFENVSLDIAEILNNITVVDGETLNLVANLFGANATVALSKVEGNLALESVDVAMDGMSAFVTPANKAVYEMSTAPYYNAVTLLDLLDASNEINLNAEIAGFNIDLNVNLTTMTVLAKTELYGKTLHAKIENNKIYVSYMGLNVFVGMTDINTILEKIKPFLGDSLDTGAFENVSLDIADILNNITVTDGDTLNLVANLFGANATVALGKTDGNLSVESIDVAMDGMSAFVTPANKAVYAMSTAPYYNAVSLLNILDESNEINLNAEIAGFNIDLNVNLTTMTVLAKTELYGKTLHAKIENNKIYVSYMGLNVFVGMADINTVLEKIKPFLGDSLDTGAFENVSLDIADILNNITVTDGETLNLVASLFGMNATVALGKTDGNLSAGSNLKRALELVNKPTATHAPLVGTITAGQPILAYENIEGTYPIPTDLFGSGEMFLLHVKGDSMINDGIYDGDTIVVKKQSTANNGEIVAAMIDDSATVKRFYKEHGHFRLQPANDTMQPIICNEVEILGVIVGLMRKL